MEAVPKSWHLPHLEGVRAIAIVLVFLYHVKVPGFSGGYFGVDVFIVVSGYLISAVIINELEQTGRFRFRNFYGRRVRRLVPALTAMSLAFLAVGVVLFSPEMLIRLAKESIAGTLSVSNIQFWRESDYFDSASALKPLLHTWSLGLEEQYYFVWPAMVTVAWRFAGRRGFVATVVATAVASMIMNVGCSRGVSVPSIVWLRPLEDGAASTFFLLPFRAFEFALGALLVVPRTLRIQSDGLASTLAFGGASLIALAACGATGTWGSAPWQALVPCVGALLLVAVGGQGVAGRLLSSPPLTWIGLRSYSLYLFHWPVIVVWTYLFASMSGLDVMVVSIVVVTLSIVCHTFVEQPFRLPSTPILQFVPWIVAMLILSIAIILMNGWSFRITPPEGLPILESAKEFHREFYGGRNSRPPDAGNFSASTVLLVGDSHGRHYSDGLEQEIVRPEGLSLTVLAGKSCIHLPGIMRTTSGENWQVWADSGVNEILHHIAAARVQPIVVMSHSWLNQMARSRSTRSDGERSAGSITADDVVAGILALQSAGRIKWLVVIGQLPGAGRDDIYDELMRPSLSRKPISDIASSIATAATIEFNGALALAAAATGQFTFIDPLAVLCDGPICANLDDEGRPLYSDSLHLSTFGSRYFVRKIRSRLMELIRERECEAVQDRPPAVAR